MRGRQQRDFLMPRKVIITCAITGGGAITKNSKYVPITPQQIAEESISAAKAGASVVHIHVRDPKTGGPKTGNPKRRKRRSGTGAFRSVGDSPA